MIGFAVNQFVDSSNFEGTKTKNLLILSSFKITP